VNAHFCTEGQLGEELYYHAFLNRDRLVHIVDPDPSTCEALSVLFRLEGFQTSFSLDVMSFYAALDRRHPDVAIINVRIGAEDGIAVLHRVKEMRTGTPVFMLSNDADVGLAVRAMKAGASDIITKPVDTERLVRAVVEALRQDVHLGALNSGRRPVEVRGFAQLTPREREVLQLITNGQSNKEAGRQLGISPRTIEVHRARVMEKLGAKNTADLMRIVLTS
jgi:two-component system, LuxR family, response regulator FixJ